MTGAAAREDTPRVAVIIPCFNDGSTLGEAIASASCPMQEECEIIVVDDGSSEPATIGLLDELEQRGIRVLHQRNSGPAAARMVGVRAASARYIFPLDADDLLETGALAALANALDASPEAVAAWGDWSTFGDICVPIRTKSSIDPWLETYVHVLPGESLFRRDAVLEVGGWSEEPWAEYEDWNLWLSLAERGYKGVHLPIRMMRYRVHGTRLWRAAITRHDEICAQLRVLHPALFANRQINRKLSPAPWHVKLALPLLARLTFLPGRVRLALSNLLANPGPVARQALARRRYRAASAIRRAAHRD